MNAARFRACVIASACLSVVPLATACSTWHVATVSPAEVMADAPSKLLVESTSGTIVEMANPSIVGDSLIGVVPGTGTPGQPLERAAFALPDVSRVATRRLDMRKTVSAFVAPAGLALLGIQVMAQ